ncbi:TM0106 family RecB-like putative nuclease [Patescibacteria group bacterium]|nr:TM0106 family RecB-like putative nuclease [Patescibacteria group bacterium]MBU2613709.1 TM0106 family RecB-like putative nuclease [Patescibacteria group bacterium]
MSAHRDYLTASDFYRLFQCPHWSYYERFATKEEQAMRRPVTEGEKRLWDGGIQHEKEVVTKLFAGTEIIEVPKTTDAEADCAATVELMKKGVLLIYQGTLTDGDWTGRPDLLERRDGESVFGPWHYVPLDVKSTYALEKYQKFQLTFYAVLLERIQKRFPATQEVINAHGDRLPFQAVEMLKEFEETVVELERIRAGEIPDPVLRKSCFDVGPWGKLCERLATSTDDIAQLFNVNVPKLRALRDLGVRTVADAAEMDPATLAGTLPGLTLHGLEVVKLQARSLKDRQVFVREPVVLPTAPLEIHFDIESDPPSGMDYLYGIFTRDGGTETYLPFVAETSDGEGEMWKRFLAWLETLPPEYVVFHYAPYEKVRLAVLEKRYGGSPWLDLFRERMVDVKDIVSSSVVFPLYFYGLKYVAPFLGFSWTGDVKGGAQSVDVYERYLETKDRALLDAIIQYNEDDVRATAVLTDWMRVYATERTSYDEPYPWVHF